MEGTTASTQPTSKSTSGNMQLVEAKPKPGKTKNGKFTWVVQNNDGSVIFRKKAFTVTAIKNRNFN